MIFHRLHQIIILLIYLSLSATSYGYTFEHKIENYGLTFAAHTVDQDHRTSLILNSGKGISFPAEGFIMNFDIKLRQELYTYGYILRVISHNDQNLDLVSYLYDSKISIISGSSHEKSQMVYLADSMLIKKDQWMPIQIQFFPNSAKIKINGKNIYLSHSFRDFNDVQIIFGASNLGRFFSGDVAPMSIRNLSLQSLQGKTFYYWKLDRSSKTTNNFVYDSISDLPAYVKNGKWEIDKHYHWQRVTSFEIDYKNPQLAFDEIKGNFFVASDKKLYTYNVNNKTLDTLSFKGAPFLGVSSQMLFHPLKKTLLSYNIYHNKLNWFNPTTSSWSVNQKITVDDNQHHNRFFDKDHDKLYLYGGYGRHQYSGALYEYNLKDNFKWSQMNLDTLISPRYLSALGKYSDNKLLVLGGYGSHSGKQEDFPQNFYDLYLLNLNTGTCKKLWEMNHTDEHFVMGNSAIVDTLTNSIYALTYRNDCYNTAIYLSQFLIKTNRPIRQIVSDSILYKFRDIYSYCDLFYHPNDTSLYAVILEPSKNESSLCRIYKLAFPPLIPTKTSNIENKSDKWGYLTGITIFILILLMLHWRKKRQQVKKLPETKTLNNLSLAEKLEHIPLEITTQKINRKEVKSTIFLVGGFQVFDSLGQDITGDFTPTLKHLFLFLLLNSIKNEKGVTSQRLDETFWFDMSKTSAANNRSVNIRKLRLLASKIGDITIVHKNGYWFLELGTNVTCDYYHISALLEDLKNRKQENLSIDKEKLELLLTWSSPGSLLPNINIEWLDEYKSDYYVNITDTLLEIATLDSIKDDPRLLFRIVDVILAIDCIDEDAIRLKCTLLYKMGHKGLSKQCYDKFCSDYERILNTPPEFSYEEFVY